MRNRYHKPHDENRIFMFLDLKGSTTITEKLGHKIFQTNLKTMKLIKKS